MKLKQRIAALENGFNGNPTELYMPDGSTVLLTGKGDLAIRLLGCIFDGGRQTPEQKKYLELIRHCKSSNDGLVDLTRALLLSPKEPQPGEAFGKRKNTAACIDIAS